MLLSMTAFVSKTVPLTVRNETISLTISIKTLNSRFFEIICKMPPVLGHCESIFHKMLKEKLIRGSIQCSIYASSLAPFTGRVKPSLHTIEAYLQAIDLIKKTFAKQYQFNDNVALKDLLSLPNIFENTEEEPDQTIIHQITAVLNELITEIIMERRREGQTLQQDIELRIANLNVFIQDIEQRSTIVLFERREKLQRDIQELLKNTSDEARDHHLQQLHSQLERMDIHEEIVRFKMHLINIQESIDHSGIEKGKKIDFILQELLRETNTIASKCLDGELSRMTVNCKVELEKAREQAQNIV